MAASVKSSFLRDYLRLQSHTKVTVSSRLITPSGIFYPFSRAQTDSSNAEDMTLNGNAEV